MQLYKTEQKIINSLAGRSVFTYHYMCRSSRQLLRHLSGDLYRRTKKAPNYTMKLGIAKNMKRRGYKT